MLMRSKSVGIATGNKLDGLGSLSGRGKAHPATVPEYISSGVKQSGR
jgi:hypothetical protein